MMKRFLLASAALLFAFTGFSQHHEKCGAHIMLEKQLQDPETRAKYEDFQESLRRYVQNPQVRVNRDENGVRIVPVVFHILHDDGSENISKDRVLSQLEVMNQDYRRLNPDTVNTPERFYGDTEYTHFEFNADAIDVFVNDSAYTVLHNRYDETYIFHFEGDEGTLSDSLMDDFEGFYGNFTVVEVPVSSNADSAQLAVALTNSINGQNGFIASYERDTTFVDAPNFTVDGAEVDSLNYTSEHTYTTAFAGAAPSFTVDGTEQDTLFYTTEHTFTTSFVDAAPSFTVDGTVEDTLFYTSVPTYTTSWNGTDTDTTYSDTLMVELFEDVSNPLTATDTLNVFPADIEYDIYDGSGAIIGTNGFAIEDTLVLSYTILVDTVYSDTLLVELFEDVSDPFAPTDTLNVFQADITYDVYDASGSVIATNGFVTEDTLVLDYTILVDTTYSDTLEVVLFEDSQNPLHPTQTLYVFDADVTYDDFDENGDVIATNMFTAEGDLDLSYTAVPVAFGAPRVEVSTDGLGYVDDVLVSGIWPLVSTIVQKGTYIPADSEVEFRLATKDPLGNCTDGIVRVFTSKTNDANNGTGFKGESYWSCQSYLNVWVVNNIDMDLGSGTVLGYAQFPGAGLCSTDGITVIANNINTANAGGRTATHEVGHWLSLIHVWGDAVCGSDDVSDTPVNANPNFGICGNHPTEDPWDPQGPSTYHSEPYNTPGCNPDNPDGETFNNYMDYSPDVCMNMFTLGQKERMDFVFHGDENTPGFRSYMISQENLVATGVADPYTPSNCAPISSFYFDQTGIDYATRKMICAGEEVKFEEDVYNAEVDSYAWSFEGGQPSTATSANPSVTYDTPGVYDVSLTASNDVGQDTHTEEDMVIVSSTTAQYSSEWGYVHTFWRQEDFLEDFVVFNHDNSANKWEWSTGTNGGQYARMYNLDNNAGEVDELISPSYDLSSIPGATLKFRYSGAAVDATPDDRLEVRVSDDCGEKWGGSRLTLEGQELTNAGLVSGGYKPNQNSTWNDVTVDLGPDDDEANVRILLRWISGGRSNNFYIDDFTVSLSPIGMEDLENHIGLSIAPNPTLDRTTVTMNLLDASNIRLEIMDVLGKNVTPILNRNMSVGSHKFEVDMSSFTSGVYYLRIMVDGDMLVKKVVKN